ncbi:MAG: hypothetical protein WCO45_08890 [Pseudanabaena sp. ELA607]|jgi:hypothetical protein
MGSVTTTSLITEISALLPLSPQTPEDFDQLILNQSISLVVNHALEYSRESVNHPDLVPWLMEEIKGYSQACPHYRQRPITYIDVQGQAIGGLQNYQIYPIALGITKLESHLKNGLTMRLPAQVKQFLSQQCNQEVYAAHLAPPQILGLLEDILKQLQQYILN